VLGHEFRNVEPEGRYFVSQGAKHPKPGPVICTVLKLGKFR
jgi:hypothetical protein